MNNVICSICLLALDHLKRLSATNPASWKAGRAKNLHVSFALLLFEQYFVIAHPLFSTGQGEPVCCAKAKQKGKIQYPLTAQ